MGDYEMMMSEHDDVMDRVWLRDCEAAIRAEVDAAIDATILTYDDEECVMYVYWHEDLGRTRNEEDMESLCCDAQGRPVVWPEDMGWEKICIRLTDKVYKAWLYGEWVTIDGDEEVSV